MRSTVLRARVCEIQRRELYVGVAVGDAAFEASHGFLGRDGFAAYEVGYFEVEGDVFEGGGRGTLDLSIEFGSGGVATEP